MNRYRTVLYTKASRLLLVLSVLLLVALFFCSPDLVPTAHAASAHAQVPAQPNTFFNCQNLGSLIESDNLYDNGTKIGELDVYYNSSTGYNCAYTTSVGPSWGVSKYMGAEIHVCAETSPGPKCTTAGGSRDYGNYSYYAGPVGVYAQGHCIEATGVIDWNGYRSVTYTGGTGAASHCS